jgi:protein-S-isoprenylcysteine O-methyltransferase Ste14
MLSKIKIAQLWIIELIVVAIGLSIYWLFPFDKLWFSEELGTLTFSDPWQGKMILFYTASIYLLMYPFICWIKGAEQSRGSRLLNWCRGQLKFASVRPDLLILLLKLLFIPLMYLGVITYGAFLEHNIYALQNNSFEGVEYFNRIIFPLVVNLIMFLALGVYAFGYMVESKALKTNIQSVDETFMGWLVCIICYVPFFTFICYVIPMATREYEFFINQEITAIVRSFLLLVMSFKISAIFTLGAKSSNLTNRGVVTSGIYKWIRHPHYLCKLIVWWTCSLPTLWQHPLLIGGMIFWTVIYVLRALTEEQHLMKDEAYVVYMKEVKWRFVPRVY